MEIKDDRKPEYERVYELNVDRSEYIDRPAYQPREKKPEKTEKTEDESDDTEEEFSWFWPVVHENESHVVFLNHRRRTLLPGEQCFYCYGNRSNHYLLINYGFCFANNRYDSMKINLKMDVDLRAPLVHFMIDFRASQLVQPVKLKNDQLNSMMLSYFRSVLK